MDYYSLLGVNRGASQDEIKKAYRKASMKHHPDRGGNEAEFKKINEAYDTLSDPQKKQMYDMGVNPNQQGRQGFHQGPFEFRFDSGNFDDIFGGFGFGNRRRVAKNKHVNISVTINLEDVFYGKTLHAEVQLPSGNKKLITIDIPKGIEDNQQIRYEGLGDDGIQGIPNGDLIVNIRVISHPIFARQYDNLILEKHVSIWDCLLGSSISIHTIDGRILNINVPAGTQPDTILRVTGEGLPNVRTHKKGHLLLKIKIDIPKNLTEEQKERIRNLKNSF